MDSKGQLQLADAKRAEDPVGSALAKLKEIDPTGGLSIVDCKHGFDTRMLIVGRRGEWHVVMGGNLQCEKCENRIAMVTTQRISCCPICGIACDSAPHRNYVIGKEILLDRHILVKLKLFDVVTPQEER